MSDYVLCIDDINGISRKLTRITSFSNGDFAVNSPYHTANQGYLFKYIPDYSQTDYVVSRSEAVQEFTAEDQVKLSYHLSGFIQFSSSSPNKIISGIDPETQEPRGLGILGPPINANYQGPSCGLTAWGIEDFQEYKKSTAEQISFRPSEIYYRRVKPSDLWNGYLVEMFLFGTNRASGIRTIEGKHYLDLGFPLFDTSFAVLRLRILELENSDFLMGILVSRVNITFPHKSGYSLSSLSNKEGHALMAFYPRPFSADNAESIMYKPSQ